MDTRSVNHQEIVKNLLSNKAIDFNAIGKTVAELGPSLALSNEPWEGFCGTVRRFIILYQLRTPEGPVENLGELANEAKALRS